MNDKQKNDIGTIMTLMILMKINPDEKNTFIKGIITGFVYLLLVLLLREFLIIWLMDMKNALGL